MKQRMKMNENYNHLMMMYERMYKMGIQSREMIEEGNLDELENIAKNKGELIKQILRFEKTFKLEKEEKEAQKTLRTKIEQLEKSNIELLKEKQENLKKELTGVSTKKKVVRAYMAKIPEMYSTIDIVE